MALQDLSKSKNREELFVMPLNKEFEELSEDESKHSLNDDGTLTLKNKLVMKQGKHNEVNYSWDVLKESYMTGEGGGLYYDHEDSVKNYAGLIKNLRADDETEEIYGDVHVTNKQAALDISLGAKFGISPTIEAEKVLRNGEKHAIDPLFLSYALVLRPAVRETMLNNESDANTDKRRFNKLEDNTREKFELAEKDARIQKLEDEAAAAKEKSEEQSKEIEESKKKIEDSEKKEVAKESEDLCALECKIGFTSEAEKNSRLEELKSLSAETRSTLKSTHEKYAKTLKLGEGEEDNGEATAEALKESFLAFRVKYMKDNPDASEEDVKAAFAKLAAEEDKDPEEKKNEDLKEANPQKRMRNELAEESTRQAKINSNILAYMDENYK